MTRFTPRYLPQLSVLCCLLCASCADRSDTAVAVAPGVAFDRSGAPGDGFQTITVDLAKADFRPVVVASNVSRQGDAFVGDAFVVRDWCEKKGAIGGMNGGYFGKTYDETGSRKQIIQLAVVEGRVVAPGSDMASSRTPGERYLRSAIGFDADGTPEIAWATGTVKNVVRAYGSPTNPDQRKSWGKVRYAVACGPRLYAGGVERITDKEERLVSGARTIRAFVAYDADDDGKPLHFVMGRADAATYTEVASFLSRFFAARYQTRPQEAMCLDGGSSSQLVYRGAKGLVDAEPTGVRVPTALLLLPKAE